MTRVKKLDDGVAFFVTGRADMSDFATARPVSEVLAEAKLVAGEVDEVCRDRARDRALNPEAIYRRWNKPR